MAKLAVTVAVVFLLLAVSPAHFREVDLPEVHLPEAHLPEAHQPEVHLPEAHLPEAHLPEVHLPEVDLPEVDLPEHDVDATLETETTISENQKAIFPPSEDVGSDSATNLEFNSEDTESKPEILEVESGPDTHAVPLTMISFRPINRQFPRRPLLTFHDRHRLNCRQRRQFRPWDPRFEKKNAIPFGDDMIRSDDGMNFDTVHPGGVRMVPAKWVRFQGRYEGPRVIFRDEGIFRGPGHYHGDEENERKVRDEAIFRSPPHFHGQEENEIKFRDATIFRGPRHFHMEEVNKRKEHGPHHHHYGPHRHEEEEQQKGGFLKSFRKFLNRF